VSLEGCGHKVAAAARVKVGDEAVNDGEVLGYQPKTDLHVRLGVAASARSRRLLEQAASAGGPFWCQERLETLVGGVDGLEHEFGVGEVSFDGELAKAVPQRDR
jgi:hypothetical protein